MKPIYTVGPSRWTLYRYGRRIETEEGVCDIANMIHDLAHPGSAEDGPRYSVDDDRRTLLYKGWSVSAEEVVRDIANMVYDLMRPCPECRAVGEKHKLDCQTGAGKPTNHEPWQIQIRGAGYSNDYQIRVEYHKGVNFNFWVAAHEEFGRHAGLTAHAAVTQVARRVAEMLPRKNGEADLPGFELLSMTIIPGVPS